MCRKHNYDSSLRIFNDGAVLLRTVIWTLSIVLIFFNHDVSRDGPPIEASSIDRTQQSRFHLMTREEPSLETSWLKNIRTMDKVKITDRSNITTVNNHNKFHTPCYSGLSVTDIIRRR
jgi:hypothetical protein